MCLKLFETCLKRCCLDGVWKAVEGINQCLKHNPVLHLSTTHISMTAEVNSYEKIPAPFGHFAVKSPGKMRSLKSSVLCFKLIILIIIINIIV